MRSTRKVKTRPCSRIENRRYEVATFLLDRGGKIDPSNPAIRQALAEARDCGYDEICDAGAELVDQLTTPPVSKTTASLKSNPGAPKP